MREFSSKIKLEKGLRQFSTGIRSVEGLTECFNLAPAENGLEVHESINSLNASGVTWGGHGAGYGAAGGDGPGGGGDSGTLRDIVINVQDYSDDSDLEDVTVYIDGVSQGTTDSDGNITINDIAVGGHTLKMTKTGYYDSDADTLYNDFIMVV